ncbi:hypothetical protein HDU99_004550 [Rhizoclosmatium hyalinum]|nr:hypothetical protein HDU99_004550 [Rhizoclosmatium hyalinum]
MTTYHRKPCQECRVHKKGCSKEVGGCFSCKTKGTECVYPEPKKSKLNKTRRPRTKRSATPIITQPLNLDVASTCSSPAFLESQTPTESLQTPTDPVLDQDFLLSLFSAQNLLHSVPPIPTQFQPVGDICLLDQLFDADVASILAIGQQNQVCQGLSPLHPLLPAPQEQTSNNSFLQWLDTPIEMSSRLQPFPSSGDDKANTPWVDSTASLLFDEFLH